MSVAKFRVYQEYTCWSVYEIEADDAEDARDKIRFGEYDWNLDYIEDTEQEVTGNIDVELIEDDENA